MSDVTEIYICKYGQRLEEGSLEISREIRTRDQADEDARELIHKDGTIHRVAYYAVKETGDFHLFHTFVNARAEPEDHTIRPLPPGVRPTVFSLRRSAVVKSWKWFASLF